MVDPRALGLYVLTAAGMVPGRHHLDVARAAIEGGATAIQLRAPELADRELLPVAVEMAARCRDEGVLFVVNDRIDVALASDADGVHLGQQDALAGARERLGSGPVLGISVAGATDARDAESAGADYLGATVWASATKRETVPLGIDGLRAVVDATSLPVVGIGGIDAANAAWVLEAGAAGIAVVSAVAAAGDPVEATRELLSVVARSIGVIGEARGAQ